MTTTEIKQHIYTLEPAETKEIYSYCSDLMRDRSLAEIRGKNKVLIHNYTEMIHFIEDKLFFKIISNSRKRECAYARYCLYRYIQDELIESSEIVRKNVTHVVLIAEIFKKDHASIIHGFNTYDLEIHNNSELQFIDTQIKPIIEMYKQNKFVEDIKNIIQ